MILKFKNNSEIIQHIQDVWTICPPLHKDFILSSKLSDMYTKDIINFDSDVAFSISNSFVNNLYIHNMILNISDDFDEKKSILISNMILDRCLLLRSSVVDSLRYISDCYENLPNEYDRFIAYVTKNDSYHESTYFGCTRLIRIHVLCDVIHHLNVDDSLLFSEYKNIGYIIEEYLSLINSRRGYILYDLKTSDPVQQSILTIKVTLKLFVTIIKYLVDKMKNRTYSKRTFINKLQTYNQLSYFCNINPQKGNITTLRFI